jgi:hypothetical protein
MYSRLESTRLESIVIRFEILSGYSTGGTKKKIHFIFLGLGETESIWFVGH